MTTPPQEPLVPPSGGHPSVATPHPQPAGAWGQEPYPTSWQQPLAAPTAWGGPEHQALREARAALRRSRTALGWAIGAAVGAFLAMGIALVSVLAAGSGEQDDYSYDPLRSEVVGLPDGSPLSGDRLERPLVDLLRSYGDENVEVSCPDTAVVTVSTTVVCTGVIEGSPWTGIVFFEDAKGTFVVVEV